MTRRALASLLAILILAGASGCARHEPAPRSSLADPSATADLLSRALADGDRASFVTGFAATGPAAMLADRMWANLSQFTEPSISIEAGHLLVGWSVPGDARPAVDSLTATWDDSSGRPLLASITTGVGERVPLWLSDDLTVTATDGCTLIVATRPARDLAPTCAGAAQRVLDAGLPTLSPTWSQALVVEIPATADDFASLTGTDPADNVGVGGLTQREGTRSTPGPARVVVNPASAWSAPLDQVESLLAHEGVHHALADLDPALPLWAAEGLADRVALPAHPAWQAQVVPRLVAAYGTDPGKLAMPTDADFVGDAVADHDDLVLAYDTAWLMVDTLLARRGAVQGLSDLGRLAAGGQDIAPDEWLGWARARLEALAR